MAKITESKFYTGHLKRLLTSAGWSVERVDLFGWPDVHCIRNGVVLWIELKTVDRYPVEELRPDWRRGQLAWIRNYRAHGGNALLGMWIENDIYFLDPKPRYDINDLVQCAEVTKNGKIIRVSGGNENFFRFAPKT